MFNTRNLHRRAETPTEVYGFLFDLDGAVVDSASCHLTVWQNLCIEHEIKLSIAELEAQLYGTPAEIVRRLWGPKLRNEEVERIANRHAELFCQLCRPNLRLIEGLKKFLDDARAANLPMGISCNASTKIIHFVLDNLYLNSYFKVHVGAEDIERGKPYPDVYLKAALRMGMMPEDCISFESSGFGVDAALRAGVKVFLLAPPARHVTTTPPNIIQTISDYRTLRPALAHTYSKMIAL